MRRESFFFAPSDRETDLKQDELYRDLGWGCSVNHHQPRSCDGIPEIRPQEKTARFFFRYSGRQYNQTEKVEDRQHANRLLAIIEETLIDLERGKRFMPADVDLKTFIMTGGKVEKRSEPVSDPFQPADSPATIASVFETYFETLTVGSKASNSIRTEEIHSRHFKRVFRDRRRLDALSVDVLQKYVDKRVKEGVVRDTIHKELSTLRIVWTWESASAG